MQTIVLVINNLSKPDSLCINSNGSILYESINCLKLVICSLVHILIRWQQKCKPLSVSYEYNLNAIWQYICKKHVYRHVLIIIIVCYTTVLTEIVWIFLGILAAYSSLATNMNEKIRSTIWNFNRMYLSVYGVVGFYVLDD